MTESEQLQQAFHRYESENGHMPTGTRLVVDWAISQGLLTLPTIDPRDILANKMSRALRQEQNPDGTRKNHAAKYMANGIQQTFWGETGFASHSHMQISFGQRREQIKGECVQLNKDVEGYNKHQTEDKQIEIIFDFTEDIAEQKLVAII